MEAMELAKKVYFHSMIEHYWNSSTLASEHRQAKEWAFLVLSEELEIIGEKLTEKHNEVLTIFIQRNLMCFRMICEFKESQHSSIIGLFPFLAFLIASLAAYLMAGLFDSLGFSLISNLFMGLMTICLMTMVILTVNKRFVKFKVI
jgi:hypothetical protein